MFLNALFPSGALYGPGSLHSRSGCPPSSSKCRGHVRPGGVVPAFTLSRGALATDFEDDDRIVSSVKDASGPWKG
jgi:hypothetical protein